jgi:L-lactate dehydrogenase complex protein LldG
MGSVASIFSSGDPWLRLPVFTGWGYSKDFPRPATRSFRSRYDNRLHPDPNSDDQTAPIEPTPKTGQEIVDTLNAHKNLSIGDFASELEALGAKFTRCAPDEVPEKVMQILRERGIDEILAWDDKRLPSGILDRLADAGIKVDHPASDRLELNSRVRAGLTGAVAAVAETGSLLLSGGQGRPLTASLLPEIHIALLREQEIYENLAQVLNLEDVKVSSAAVLISGPSRTADIEMTLTIGVHGPGELHVICIQD